MNCTGEQLNSWPQENVRALVDKRIRIGSSFTTSPMTKPGQKTVSETPSAEKARAALITRLEQLHRRPGGVRAPHSLQPTPEAAKSRVRRLRQKQRRLLQRAKRSVTP